MPRSLSGKIPDSTARTAPERSLIILFKSCSTIAGTLTLAASSSFVKITLPCSLNPITPLLLFNSRNSSQNIRRGSDCNRPCRPESGSFDIHIRPCLKKAFRERQVTVCGRFRPNEGKIYRKVGLADHGNIFQTRFSISDFT